MALAALVTSGAAFAPTVLRSSARRRGAVTVQLFPWEEEGTSANRGGKEPEQVEIDGGFMHHAARQPRPLATAPAVGRSHAVERHQLL